MIYVSDIGTFLYCKRLFFLRKIHKLKVQKTQQITFGDIFHHANELLYTFEPKFLINYDMHDFNALLNIYKTLKRFVIKKSMLRFKHDISRLNLDPMNLINELDQYLNTEIMIRSREVFNYSKENQLLAYDLVQNLFPKVITEFRIKDPSLDLIGRIDRLLIYPTHQVPVEFKTSSRIYDSHIYQASAYGVMLKHSGIKVNYVKILLSNFDEKIIYLNPFHEIELRKLLNEMKYILDNKILPQKTTNKNKCQSCPLKDVCDNLD